MADVFYVAEVGSNFKSIEDLRLSIKIVKAMGAQCAKFQLFDHKALYGYEGPKLEGEIPYDWIYTLAGDCRKSGVEFMCTAFDHEGYEFLNPFVKKHKVASSNLTNQPLLKLINSYGKTVFLSTGASSIPEIRMAVDCLPNCEVVVMYCVAAYPAKQVDLRCIPEIKKALGGRVKMGYSDHSLDILNVPRLAVEMGAEVIEKHFNGTMYQDTPDAPHSINSMEFINMVASIDGIFPMRVGNIPEERGMVVKYRNRCMAIKDIEPGEKLVLGENYGVYRSKEAETSALSGFMAYEINGKEAIVKMEKGAGISAHRII
jgi:N-acetylneuraminate synthase